jgi:WD40 repeat protein
MLRTFVHPTVWLSLLTLFAAPAFAAAQPPRAPAVDALGDPLPAGAVARLGTTRLRQADPVRFIAYPTAGVLLTAGDTGVYTWDAATGKELRHMALPRPAVSRFPFGAPSAPLLSGDGKTLLLGLDAGDCIVVDVATGKRLREFKIDADMPGMGAFRGFPGASNAQHSVSHDGRLLLTRDSNPFGVVGNGTTAKVKLWDTVAGKMLRELNAKEKGATLTAAVLTRDGKAVLAVEGPGAVVKGGPDAPQTRLRLLDAATGNELRSVPLPGASVSELHLSPDGKLVAVGTQGQALRLLDAATGKELRQFANKAQGNLATTFFARDGKTLFIVSANEATQYEVETGKELRHFLMAGRKDDPFGLAMGRLSAPAAALSPDGRTLALPAGTTVTRWEVESGKEIAGVAAHQDRIDSVAFAPDGGRVLTGAADGKLYCGTPPANACASSRMNPRRSRSRCCARAR